MNAFNTTTVGALDGAFTITPTVGRGALISGTVNTSYTFTRDQLFMLINKLISAHGEAAAQSLIISLAIEHVIEPKRIAIALRAAQDGDAAYFAKQEK